MKMLLKITYLILGTLVFIASPLSAEEAENNGTPKITINGHILTQQNYANARALLKKINPHAKQQEVIDEMISRELLRQDATKQGIDKQPMFEQRIAEFRNNLLISMAMREYLRQHPINDEVLQKEYDNLVAKAKRPPKFKMAHILVETEAEAKAIIVELQAGKEFGPLAKEKSTDSVSKDKEGSLGWVTEKQVPPEVGKALGQLEKDQYTATPVKSAFGWHVIKVEDKQEERLPSFEAVKEKVRERMQNQQMQDYLKELEAKADVQILTTPLPEKDDSQ